jgi:hypothetical protein
VSMFLKPMDQLPKDVDVAWESTKGRRR